MFQPDQMENIRGIKKTNSVLTDDFKTPGRSKIIFFNLNNKIRHLSGWSTACWSLGYLFVTLSIIKIYQTFNGTHPVLLAVTLFNLCFAMGVLMFLACKITSKDNRLTLPGTAAYIRYQLQRLAAQRKLISLYMLEYTVLLIISGVFFSGMVPEVWLLLKLVLPVSIVTYVSGVYFIVISLRLTRELKNLQTGRKQIAPLEHFRQN